MFRSDERLIVIEQPAELKISHPNAVRWEAVDAIPGQVAVTPSQLLAAALRHRPDRIIMGEIRDECGYDLLAGDEHRARRNALDHPRKVRVGRAESPIGFGAECKTKSQPCIHPFRDAEAIDFVLYCERDPTGRRRVRELITVNGYSHADQSLRDRGNLSDSSSCSSLSLRNGNANQNGSSRQQFGTVWLLA